MTPRHALPRLVPSARQMYIFIYTCLCVYFVINIYAGSSTCHAVRSHGRRTQQIFIFHYSKICIYVFVLIYVHTVSACATRYEVMDAVRCKCIYFHIHIYVCILIHIYTGLSTRHAARSHVRKRATNYRALLRKMMY